MWIKINSFIVIIAFPVTLEKLNTNQKACLPPPKKFFHAFFLSSPPPLPHTKICCAVPVGSPRCRATTISRAPHQHSSVLRPSTLYWVRNARFGINETVENTNVNEKGLSHLGFRNILLVISCSFCHIVGTFQNTLSVCTGWNCIRELKNDLFI